MLLQPTKIVYEDTKSFQYNTKKLGFLSLMEMGYAHWFFTFLRKKVGNRFKACVGAYVTRKKVEIKKCKNLLIHGAFLLKNQFFSKYLSC